MHRISRCLCVFLTILLTFQLMTFSAAAEALTEGDYSYEINEDGVSVTITGYSGSEVALTLPSSLGGLAVTHIGGNAFSGNHTITSVVIPNSVTTIRSMAFYNCYKLADVTVGPYMVSIGNQAFQGTAWLSNAENGPVYLGRVLYTYAGTMPADTEITVRYGTASIAAYAFYGQADLKAVYLPVGIHTVGSFAFANCTSLIKTRIPPSVQRINSGAFLNAGNAAIHGTYGSVAEAFADSNKMLFTYDATLDYPAGDVTGDKKVDSRDLRVLMRMLLTEDVSVNEERVASCDFVYDGTIDSADIRAILRSTIGL